MEKEVNASLILRDSEELKHILLVPGDEVKFGRDCNNDVRLALFPLQDVVFQLATADISRQHFVIQRHQQGYTIQDLRSTNGTSVNCIAVLEKERDLDNNQVIDIGGVLDLKVFCQKGVLWLQRITNTPQESYLLFPEDITIGSASNNVLVIPSAGISPHHAKICYHEKKYFISKVDEDARIMLNSIPLQPDQQYHLEDEVHVTLEEIDILFKLQKD